MTSTNSPSHNFTTTSSRHHAITTRNPLAHNAFIYSITTTRIYCRPTCPSRPARRSNIIFHDSSALAAAAGFRACKRCSPNEDTGDSQVMMCEKACALVRNESDVKKWSVKGLAREVGVTESHFCRVFKKVMGITVGEYRNCVVTRKDFDVNLSTNLDRESGIGDDAYLTLENLATSLAQDSGRGVDEFVGNAAMEEPSQVALVRGLEWDCFEFVDFNALECT